MSDGLGHVTEAVPFRKTSILQQQGCAGSAGGHIGAKSRVSRLPGCSAGAGWSEGSAPVELRGRPFGRQEIMGTAFEVWGTAHCVSRTLSACCGRPVTLAVENLSLLGVEFFLSKDALIEQGLKPAKFSNGIVARLEQAGFAIGAL